MKDLDLAIVKLFDDFARAVTVDLANDIKEDDVVTVTQDGEVKELYDVIDDYDFRARFDTITHRIQGSMFAFYGGNWYVEEGKFYDGYDSGKIFFDVVARKIRFEGSAIIGGVFKVEGSRIRVIRPGRYYENVTREWDVKPGLKFEYQAPAPLQRSLSAEEWEEAYSLLEA
jgi:hypothetical protein